jgi:hypothetical protein
MGFLVQTHGAAIHEVMDLDGRTAIGITISNCLHTGFLTMHGMQALAE